MLDMYVFGWYVYKIIASEGYGLVDRRNKSKNSTMPPWTAYWKAGLTNCFGPAMGFAALKYISYPAQVLVKSSKMIPVMLMGTLLHGIRYPPSEYFCCSLVIAGVSMFALKSSSHGASRLVSPNAPLGYGMCLANLVLDGYTNAKQDEINRRYKGGSNPIDMMCWMNFWTGVFYVPVMFIFTSTGKEVIEFCAAYPEAIVQLLLLCLCGAIGQLFIYYTIRQFGSLILTLVTTTRKFFSILFSVLLAGNTLLFEQWIAVFFVFTGLLLSTITKHRRRIKPRQHED